MSLALPWLNAENPDFPATETALKTPNGLLAAGGELSEQCLLKAYTLGIFPWYEEGQPVLWWSPDPRMVLFIDELHISRSMRSFLHKHRYTVTLNRNFAAVIENCAGPRAGSRGTWITDTVKSAYQNLHASGFAHSVEVWDGKVLVGGLYGIALEGIFFGESMFSHASNASKLALIHLVDVLHRQNTKIIDCQVPNPHLESLGARLIPRIEFERWLPKRAAPGISGIGELSLAPDSPLQ